MITITNATKAQIIVLVNALLGLVIAFGVNVSDVQQAAIVAGVNSVLALLVALTYKASARRTADPTEEV